MKTKVDKGELRVFLMCSRNKDNQNVNNFRERTQAFLAHDKSSSIEARFNEFVKNGVKGEVCRLYQTVNTRDPEKVRKQLIVELVTNDTINITHLQSISASVAAHSGCAKEKKWLIDFDSNDETLLQEFVDEVKSIPSASDMTPEIHKTKNGYAIIYEHGFDGNNVFNKYKEVAELKKDAQLLLKWVTNE